MLLVAVSPNVHDEPAVPELLQLVECHAMAKPGSDRDGAMVEKQAGKKCKDKLSPLTKTPKLDRSELLGKEGKVKSSMKRKLSFTNSPPRTATEERDSDTDKDGPDKKKVKREPGGKKSQAPNLLFGYPLSERKQMALLMQMTANSPDSTPNHPSQTTPVPKKVPSSTSSRQKDKVNKRNERGETPLHMAAIRGDAKQVKELISLGADVNVKDFAGWTPLHEACNLGYYDVAKVLIAAGAEVNTQGLDDDTPLHDASSSGHKDIVKLLLRHGGDAFQANKRGERPVDVADSEELEQLLKGETLLSDQDESSSDSEDPPSVNPSSMDDNMDDSDAEKDSDMKAKSATCVPDLDEYEFKDEEEEEDLSKALNDRHILRRELRQREKEDKERNNVAGKQSAKGNSSSKSKKPKIPRIHCSSDTSSDEFESLPEKRNSPTCSQRLEGIMTKKDSSEQKDKGKIKKKNKSQNKNKENQENGKENSKTLVLQLATVSESIDKGREEDSFKMSFSPKDDSSVHLFHLSTIKSPKLIHGLTDKHTLLKQENSSCPTDTIKYNHYSDTDYSTEGSSTKAHKHKEKSKHHQRDGEHDDSHSSPWREVTAPDSTESTVRKIDLDVKAAKKHKLKHKEKDKHRRDYEAERSRHRQKDARREGHRNLEFDREFWKENFFKSDEMDDALLMKRESEEQRTSDCSPFKEEKNAKEKHSSGKERRLREERDKDKAVKKERREERPKERDDRGDCGGRIPDAEPPQSSSVKEETDEKPITLTGDQEHLEATREKTDKRVPGKEKEPEKMERRHPDKEKKIRSEHTDRTESQNHLERWKEKERSGATSCHSPGDKNYKESDKLKSLSAAKKHEDSRKNRDKLDKRCDRDYSVTEHKERDRGSSDKKIKPLEKTSDHSKSDRSKEKDCERKRKDKLKDGTFSSSSNLKVLLEEKKAYLSEGGKSLFTKSKEEAVRTPEKDRDRRERERDLDRHKDRHKDRSLQAKIGKVKPSENDTEKPKQKTPTPGARDARPKEKRLVNDDLMQTSFERMLSLKDQEIEQWHRKHLEKIKQKERERLKQRPLVDPGKSRPKDKTKTDTCLTKELMRSKSSEASDTHGREKPVKDTSSFRTMSLDGKTLPSIGTKVMSAVENCLSRSPRPEGEHCGLMSRSMSLVSVASSEDSCQAAMLTPKHVEYDSDMNLEAADLQPTFLQSSLVIQATRLPSVLDKDCVVLPNAQRPTLSSKHESTYLRAILDEDANASTETRVADSPKKPHIEGSQTREASTERDEPEVGPQSSNSESVTECKDTAGSSSPNRELPNLILCGSPAIKPTDATIMRDIPCLESPTSQPDGVNRDSDPPSVSLSTEPPEFTNPESLQPGDSVPVCIQPVDSCASAQLWDQKEKTVTADAAEHQSLENAPEGLKIEATECPVHTTSVTESLPSTDSRSSQENLDPRPDVVTCDAPMEVSEDKSGLAKDHEICNIQQNPDNPQNCSLDVHLTAEFSSESHSESMDVEASDRKPESSAEELSLAAMQPIGHSDMSSSSSCSSTSNSSSSSSSTSGNSSPQSGEPESDCCGAKLKLRSSDEDLHVPHPRKRKMLKPTPCQIGPALQQDQERESGEPVQQQSLAAIVASVKLEEIEPYQTERANPYYEFLHIRRKIEEKRKVLCSVAPQPPQYYDEYVTFNGSYLLDGNPLSKLCIPTITPPPSLPEQLKEMFKKQEVVRMKLRLQHSIEREKLIVSNEQEVLRVHYRAARTLANQTLPFSACTVLLDAEVYNMPQDVQSDDGKTSVRDRFNARQFMSWLQDVDDKFDKLKTCLLMRQQHEAAALNAVQRLEWQLKLQELDPATYKSTSIFEIPEFYIPLVEVNDDFDLTPI
ncbi:ankyrin repeat domain-containing protein 12 isoform X2 [Syngnathoides biaculeatus]|uniref:ankyrin repeat domain-containing protein 12 isoform X2 n=1 Tax=Syngnathoides biaculeatus TaxID=300417 RepID=UPI002ADDCA08|nr:ankyrin repeat domain-containing protein 12 isoform X2 [Syngnathoides biaculeatus]